MGPQVRLALGRVLDHKVHDGVALTREKEEEEGKVKVKGVVEKGDG